MTPPGRVINSSTRHVPDNTQYSQKKHLCPPAGFEPTFLAGERLLTYALDRAATGAGISWIYGKKK
jgi:hypothetical protein